MVIRFQWCPGILQLVQATNNFEKIYQIFFGASLCCSCWLILCTFVNKQTGEIILSNHSTRQVESGKRWSVTWRPVLNLKPSAERFERRMKVKMIIKRIMKALLKSKIIYSSELIYSHGLVSKIISLSMFLLRRPEYLLLDGFAKSLVLKICFCFHQDICFSFLYKWSM